MDNPLRDTGRKLKCWQRERACKFRAANDEPHHPADAHDDKLAREIDEEALERLNLADMRFYAKSGQTTRDEANKKSSASRALLELTRRNARMLEPSILT